MLGKSNEKDIQIHNMNKTMKRIERSLDILIQDFPCYKIGVMNLLISFLKNANSIDMLDKLDLLYIKNDFSKSLDLLYDEVSDIFETKYNKKQDISSELSQAMNKASELRKKIDEYITLVLSEDYFKFINDIERVQEPYYKKGILEYK